MEETVPFRFQWNIFKYVNNQNDTSRNTFLPSSHPLFKVSASWRQNQLQIFGPKNCIWMFIWKFVIDIFAFLALDALILRFAKVTWASQFSDANNYYGPDLLLSELGIYYIFNAGTWRALVTGSSISNWNFEAVMVEISRKAWSNIGIQHASSLEDKSHVQATSFFKKAITTLLTVPPQESASKRICRSVMVKIEFWREARRTEIGTEIAPSSVKRIPGTNMIWKNVLGDMSPRISNVSLLYSVEPHHHSSENNALL